MCILPPSQINLCTYISRLSEIPPPHSIETLMDQYQLHFLSLDRIAFPFVRVNLRSHQQLSPFIFQIEIGYFSRLLSFISY